MQAADNDKADAVWCGGALRSTLAAARGDAWHTGGGVGCLPPPVLLEWASVLDSWHAAGRGLAALLAPPMLL